jgi:hypothetical protein
MVMNGVIKQLPFPVDVAHFQHLAIIGWFKSSNIASLMHLITSFGRQISFSGENDNQPL